MANPAAEARAKVKAAHPEAVVVERGRNSIKHRLADAPDGRQRFALDVAIGPLHYGSNNDQEIDTALVPSTAPWDWEMTKAGFEVRALSDLSAGQVIEYRSGSEWVRFQPMALQYSNDLNQIQQISMPQAVDATVDDDTLTWTNGYGSGRTLAWQVQTARLAKLLTIDSLTDLPAVQQFILDGGNPVLELNLIFAHSGGVTPYVNGQEWERGERDTQGLAEFKDDQGNILWWFNLPRSWDAEGNEKLGTFRFKKQGNSLFVTHRVPLSFVQNAVYPLMVDTTIDEQVGASLDDGYVEQSPVFDQTGGAHVGGRTSPRFDHQAWFRFTGISGLSGVTIDVASISLWGNNADLGTPLTKIYAEDAAAPAAPTDKADLDGKARTTAGVDWDSPGLSLSAFTASPSIVAVIQELADSHDPSAIQILHDDDGSAQDGTNIIRVSTYDVATAEAPKLHIEFTAGGGGVTVLAALATATALSPAATILTGLLVAASLATATALAYAAKNVNTISASVATATARSWAVTVSGAALIAGSLATAMARSWAATIVVGGGATIVGALATATAKSYAVTVSGAALVAGALSTATARSWAAVVNPGATIAGALATATARSWAAIISTGPVTTVRRLAYYPISLVSTRFRRRGRR